MNLSSKGYEILWILRRDRREKKVKEREREREREEETER
jgi:hypothetical protein